jgi:hypothetical protein
MASAAIQTQQGQVVWGLLAHFENPATLTHGCEAVRDAGFKKWDAYAPFPVHGLNEAMGMKASPVSIIVGTMALLGFCGAFALQYWTTAVDYPLGVQGKPYGAWEAFVPVLFELSVLAAALGAIGGMLVLNNLPRWNHPLFSKPSFLGVSDDKFFIAIESSDPQFNLEETREFLRRSGATTVEAVEEDA